MAFSAPMSSSPLAPSTPGAGKNFARRFDDSNYLASNPSTTPAGPPPSSAGSFTPAGPPPSSVLGSSHFVFTKTPSISNQLLSKSTFSDVGGAFTMQSNLLGAGDGQIPVSNGRFALPDSSPPSQSYLVDDVYMGGLEAKPGTKGAPMTAASTIAQDMDHRRPQPMHPYDAKDSNRSASKGRSRAHWSVKNGMNGGVKRSREGLALGDGQGPGATLKVTQTQSAISVIAKSLANQLGVASLEESDNLILGTEGLLSELHNEVTEANEDLGKKSAVLSSTSEQLCKFWSSCQEDDLATIPQPDDVMVGIGPDENAPIAHNAIYLSTLLLPLYHPGAARGKQALAASRLNRSIPSSRAPYLSKTPANPTACPKILLDWLDKNHNPFESTLAEVQAKRPNPTAHENYWDILFMLAVRGKISDLLRMLKVANFEHAATAKEDGHGASGYHGEQLANTRIVVGRAIEVLEACPALTDDDWHITSPVWAAFRRLVEKSLDDLATLTEGRDRDLDPEESSFQASNFGLSSMSNDMTKTSRRAESRIPWTIYQNLKTLYGILLGGSSEILSSSQDWVEASLAMTAWWDGDDDDEVSLSTAGALRSSSRHTHAKGPRLVDYNVELAYQRRLASAFKRVADGNEDTFMVPDSTKPLEIALACVFENNIEGVLGLLKGFSLPIADAVAEIGSLGGWLGPTSPSGILNGFDESDLMVLSGYGSSPPSDPRDAIMNEYVEALFSRGRMVNGATGEIDGWELSVAILARSSSTPNDGSKKRTLEFLERLPLDSDEQIDKVFEICQDYGMVKEGRAMVEQYADSILEKSGNYGTAMVYYSRAHRKKKLRDVLDLLVSYSLVQSAAFPPASDLDPNLRSLLSSPEKSLRQLAMIDEEAAEMLHAFLSGYATLRRFYDLRDTEGEQSSTPSQSENHRHRLLLAARSLLAVIDSAADSIKGGLYDDLCGNIIRVDGLLALLGEASVFLKVTDSDSSPLLTLSQCFSLLKAIEDLSTVTTHVFSRCEEFYRSTLASRHGLPTESSDSPAASPRQLLRKQLSSMTSGGGTGNGSGTGSFSLVGSSILGDSRMVRSLPTTEDDTTATEAEAAANADNDSHAADSGSRMLIVRPSDDDEGKVKRGWDWRDDFTTETTPDALLKQMRLRLAREISSHWIRGEK